MTASELRVLIQSMVVFGAFAAVFAFWHAHDPFTEGMIAITILLWIAKCGVGPVLYLTMNAKIRRVALCGWYKKGKKTGSTLVMVAPSANTPAMVAPNPNTGWV